MLRQRRKGPSDAAVQAAASRADATFRRRVFSGWLRSHGSWVQKRERWMTFRRWAPFVIQLCICFAVAHWLANWQPTPSRGVMAPASRRLILLWARMFILGGTVIGTAFLSSLVSPAQPSQHAGKSIREADPALGDRLDVSAQEGLRSRYGVQARGAIALRYCTKGVEGAASDLSCDALQCGVDGYVWRWVWTALARPTADVYHRMHSYGRKKLCGGWLSVYAFDAVVSPQEYYLLSPVQWSSLFEGQLDTSAKPRCLDIGAGRCIIDSYRHLFPGGVVATEPTYLGARALSKQGVRAVRTSHPTAATVGQGFDAALLLNVLDRAARPLTLLEAAIGLVKPGGIIVIALVLPVTQYSCKEELLIPGDNFDSSAVSLLHWLSRRGLRPQRLTRCPYLCTGPPVDPVLALDAAVVLCTVGTVD